MSFLSTATTTVQMRKRDSGERGRNGEPPRRTTSAPAELALCPHREERRAVEREQQHDRDPAEQRVRAEEVGERACPAAVGVERDAVHEVRERDAPEERGTDAPEDVGGRPDRTPARAVALLPPLEGDDAHDQEDQDQEKGKVETGEHRRVPGRERRERRAARDDEPHLVAVPDGSDRLEHHVALALVAREERQQHPDSEVEALEQEICRPADADQNEPEELKVHQAATVSTPVREPRRSRMASARAGRPGHSAASARSRRPRARRTGLRTRRG